MLKVKSKKLSERQVLQFKMKCKDFLAKTASKLLDITPVKNVVETSVTINNNSQLNSPIQDCVYPDDQTQPTFEMTPGFKPFTIIVLVKSN